MGYLLAIAILVSILMYGFAKLVNHYYSKQDWEWIKKDLDTSQTERD